MRVYTLFIVYWLCKTYTFFLPCMDKITLLMTSFPYYTINDIIPLIIECNGSRVGKKQCQGTSITLPPAHYKGNDVINSVKLYTSLLAKVATVDEILCAATG